MHHQKMIILGLVAIGKKYGFEMEEFIVRTEMKRWAEIGTSTIYKILKDLQSERLLSGKRVVGTRGPAKTEYSLTAKGRKQLRLYILEALQSDKTARIDRISGLFFAPLLPRTAGLAALNRTTDELQGVIESLEEQLAEHSTDVMAEAIIQFYIDMFEAETRAIEKVSRFLS